MPVLHLVSFCLFLNKDIPRAGYRYQTNSRIALKTGVCGEVSRGIGLPFPVTVLGTTACLVEHPYSHPWRYVLKSLSLCSSPLTRGQELLSEADDASVSVLPHPAPQSPADRLLSVPNPAIRRHLEANKTADREGNSIVHWFTFFSLWIFLES